MLSQICGSLGEAHSRGLIHRDVKPANVMICERGGQFDVVKLLDFGLVKAVDTQRQAGLTSAGAVTGTPLFLSPEAISDPDTIDVRSDLYSLGALGYFLLTGTPVFSGTGLLDLCRMHVESPPEPPSQRLGSPIDGDLEAATLRCLAKQPGARFATADELSEALSRCSAAGTWGRAAARDWWRNRAAHPPAEMPAPAQSLSRVDATVITAVP